MTKRIDASAPTLGLMLSRGLALALCFVLVFAVVLALTFALPVGTPRLALALEEDSDEVALDTETEVIDITNRSGDSGSDADNGSGTSGGAGTSGGSGSSNGSRSGSSAGTTGGSNTTTSKSSTPGTGDPTSGIVYGALVIAAFGAFVAARVRHERCGMDGGA